MAIEGKALASTVTDDDTSSQNFVSLVSVFSHKRGHVLSTARGDHQQRRAIPTVRALIEALDLHGLVFSLDARHGQKKRGPLLSRVARSLGFR